MPTIQWAEDNLRLPEEGADLPGRYDISYTPYMAGIFSALDDPKIPEVVCMKAAQVGWTFGLIAWLFKNIDTDPGPMIALFASTLAIEKFVDEKLEPTIKATPAVYRRIPITEKRSSSNKKTFKRFPGGFLQFAGSGSIDTVKSTPARVVVVEEPDDSKQNIRGQGPAILLAWERTKRMRRSKRVMGGTPSVKGLSKVEEHAEQSDKRVLPIACHACSEKHVLSDEHIKWDSQSALGQEHPVFGLALPETAFYTCPKCGTPWDDWQRKENIRNTVFNAMAAGDPMCGWVPTAPYHGVAGFVELGEVYSCLPGAGVADLASAYLKAEHLASQGDQSAMIVYVNSKQARTYEWKGNEKSDDELAEFAESYREMVIPKKGLLLTAGVDIQHNRIAVIIRAWGRGEESWLVYWGELLADHFTGDKKDAVWDALDELLFQEIPHSLGRSRSISAISIDSGDGETNDAVYQWVRSRKKKHPDVQIMAIKGSSEKGNPEIFSLPRIGVDHKNPNRKTKADKYGVKVYIVGTERAKDWIAARIGNKKSSERMHYYRSVRQDYFSQMSGETKAPHKTLKKLVWQKKSGRKIEAWDCEQYALHAARAKRVHLMTEDQWSGIEKQIRPSKPNKLVNQQNPAVRSNRFSPNNNTGRPMVR